LRFACRITWCRSLSDVETRIGKLSGANPSTLATVTNRRGVISGDADFYTWGLFADRIDDDDEGEDGDRTGKPTHDVRAVGVQSFALEGGDRLLAFAVNGYNRWSNASVNELDIYVDVNGDGKDDYLIAGADFGALTAGDDNGVMGSFVFDLHTGDGSIEFFATAPTDSSTVIMPVLASQLCTAAEYCLSASNPRLTYHVESHDRVNGGSKQVPDVAKYNPWTRAITDGGFVTVKPGASGSTPVVVNSAETAATRALGLMVVTFDNKSGSEEAQLIPLDAR